MPFSINIAYVIVQLQILDMDLREFMISLNKKIIIYRLDTFATHPISLVQFLPTTERVQKPEICSTGTDVLNTSARNNLFTNIAMQYFQSLKPIDPNIYLSYQMREKCTFYGSRCKLYRIIWKRLMIRLHQLANWILFS